MRDNDITNSGKVGILFRDDSRGRDFWANRNLVEKNRNIDSGAHDGVAIDITGRTKEVRIVGNETRGPMNRTGVRIASQAGTISMVDNVIEGFSQSVVDHRKTG